MRPVAYRLNFAYGSNMLHARLRERSPSARARGIAILRGHALMWHKVARDGSGKCDIVPVQDPERLVYGVVYEIPVHEKSALDHAEGLGQGYTEQIKTVELAGQFVEVPAYVALLTHPHIHPYTWYRALVVAGAVEHHLPPPYVDALRRAPAVLDPDAERHARYMALAGASRAWLPSPSAGLPRHRGPSLA